MLHPENRVRSDGHLLVTAWLKSMRAFRSGKRPKTCADHATEGFIARIGTQSSMWPRVDRGESAILSSATRVSRRSARCRGGLEMLCSERVSIHLRAAAGLFDARAPTDICG